MTKIPCEKIGDFEIKSFGKEVALFEKNRLWISQEKRDYKDQKFILKKCKGTVCFVGLGLGIILEPLCKKKEIDKIIVIEKSKEVKKLVWEYLDINDKAEIIIIDIFDFLKKTKMKFDYIYLDVWFDSKLDNVINIIKPLIELSKKIVPEENILCWEYPKRYPYNK